MVKKILILLFVLLLLAGAALAFFVLTFDAERYRPLFIQKLSEITGAQVELEKLSLSWSGEPALKATNLNLIFGRAQPGEAPQRVHVAAVAMPVLPLLRGQLQLKAAVLSDKPNVTVEGHVEIRAMEQKTLLQDFKARLDLASVDPQLLAPFVPAWRKNGVPQFAGHVSAELPEMLVGGKDTPDFQLHVHWTDGMYAAPGLNLPLKNVKAEVLVKAQSADVIGLSADWGHGQLAASGRMDWHQLANIAGEFQAALSGADLAELAPPTRSGDPQIEGNLSAAFKGTFIGPDAQVWAHTLAGAGEVKVSNAVIKNFNLVREVLEHLSIIPGVQESLTSHLSENYLQKLKEKDTRLEPFEIPLRAVAGELSADSVRISSDTFQIHGAAQAVLDGPASGRFFVAIDPEFSKALIHGVRELEYLTNGEYQILIPLILRGKTARPEIVPDLQDMGSRLAVAKTQEVISSLLAKKKEGASPDKAASSGSTQEPEDPLAALLGQVLAGKKK